MHFSVLMDTKNSCLSLLLLSSLFLVSYAALDPRKVEVNLEEEVPCAKATSFLDALIGLGQMTELYETRRLNVHCQPIMDDTGTSDDTGGEIPRDITEMAKSALNSIGGRVTFIPYDPVYIANVCTLYPKLCDGMLQPDVAISGGITEFDRGLIMKGENVDFEAEGTVKKRPIGIDYSKSDKTSLSTVALDFNLIDTRTMSGIPRMQTVNSIKVHKALSEKELGFTLLGPTFGLRGTVKKIQGRHAAIRLLVDLSIVQMIGRFLQLPYWRLLPNAEPDPVVLEALRADFRDLEVSVRVAQVQRLLILNGYDVSISGKLDDGTKAALQDISGGEPGSSEICEDIYLRLYLSVPISEGSRERARLLARDLAGGQAGISEGIVQHHPDGASAEAGAQMEAGPALSEAGSGPLLLEVETQYLRDGTLSDIPAGEALTSRDNYSISFSSNQSCFVYIFQMDSHGTMTPLFPNPAFGAWSNPVSAGAPYRVPEDDHEWLYLDGNTGDEQIIVLASPEPIADPENLCWNLRSDQGGVAQPPQSAPESIAAKGSTEIARAGAATHYVLTHWFRHL